MKILLSWDDVITSLPDDFEGTFYCIAFYSRVKEALVNDTKLASLLHYHDEKAHQEANQSGGLLKYWFGSYIDSPTRDNMATCIWNTYEEARRSGRGSEHAIAMKVSAQSYEMWNVRRFILDIEKKNVTKGRYRFEEFKLVGERHSS